MVKLKVGSWEMDVPVAKPTAMMAAAFVWEVIVRREMDGAHDVGKQWNVTFGDLNLEAEVCEYAFGPKYFTLWGVEDGQMIMIVGDALCIRYR